MADFPPTDITSLKSIIPTYIYVWCDEDVNLQAYASAMNLLGQGYLDSMNGLNLPVYTSDEIVGPVLDWVGAGVYGIRRPTLPGTSPTITGMYGTTYYGEYNFPYGFIEVDGSTSFYTANDDIYKRILTWQLYKGDGFVFSIPWLKRRIVRFLTGIDGTDPGVVTTYNVSVTIDSSGNGVINLIDADPTIGPIFQAAVAGLAINLPFMIDWVVTLS